MTEQVIAKHEMKSDFLTIIEAYVDFIPFTSDMFFDPQSGSQTRAVQAIEEDFIPHDLLSVKKDWDLPEEDEAWKNL